MKKIIFFKNLLKINKKQFSNDLLSKYIFYKGESHLKIFQRILLGFSTITSAQFLFEINREYLSNLEKQLFFFAILGTFAAFHYSNYISKNYIKIFNIHKNRRNFYLETFSGITNNEKKIHFGINELKNFKVNRILNKGTLELNQGIFYIDFNENEFEDRKNQVFIENCLEGIDYDEVIMKKKIQKFKNN